ncbi:MAG TPA: hypothetical protein VFZ14_01495 [Burkholderiales bacterium]|nr:hypothetical protein [Burkholderiales bacterium]
MRKVIFAAATLALLAGCASNGRFLGFGPRTHASAANEVSAERTAYGAERSNYNQGFNLAIGQPVTPVQDGSDVGTYDGSSVGTPGAVTYAGTPYSPREIASRYRLRPQGERFWPPVYENSAFPTQDMWTE